jgi:small subunit ribosomal protein S21
MVLPITVLSVVVKNGRLHRNHGVGRFYRAGRTSPIEHFAAFVETMTVANGPERRRRGGCSVRTQTDERKRTNSCPDTLTPVPRGTGRRPINYSSEEEHYVQVLVRDNNVEQALKVLKKKMQREGVFREMKLRGHYEKPSERKVRERAEAIRRARKLARKKLQREGLLPMKPKVIPGAVGRGGPPRAPRF